MTSQQTLVLAWGFSGWELGVLLVLGLLIFGRRLPELGRSVGKTIVEFKKGLAGIESDVNSSSNNTSAQSNQNSGASLPPSSPAQGQSNPHQGGVANQETQGQYRPPQS